MYGSIRGELKRDEPKERARAKSIHTSPLRYTYTCYAASRPAGAMRSSGPRVIPEIEWTVSRPRFKLPALARASRGFIEGVAAALLALPRGPPAAVLRADVFIGWACFMASEFWMLGWNQFPGDAACALLVLVWGRDIRGSLV